MANSTIIARTNYFKVQDIPAFEEQIEQVKNYLEGIEVVTKEINGEQHVAVTGTSGLTTVYIEENDVYVDFDEFIQPHILEGEACIITEIGYEKLRYVYGQCLVITKTDSIALNMTDASQQAARTLLQKPQKVFHMDY